MACFTDQENDPESGLMYYGARYYDPWIGRFLEQDPALIGSVAGISFERIGSDPQEFNAYSYVGNRPTVRTDPTGEYGRGDGFTDRQWRAFDKAQQKAADRMERAAKKLEKKADKLDKKGESGGDSLREKAENLSQGASVLRNDGSDGVTLAHGVDSKTYRAQGGSRDGAAMAPIGGPDVTVNLGNPVWRSGGTEAQRAIGHESLHTTGLRHQRLGGPDGPVALKDGTRAQQNAYRKMMDTPQADISPDHLMDEAY